MDRCYPFTQPQSQTSVRGTARGVYCPICIQGCSHSVEETSFSTEVRLWMAAYRREPMKGFPARRNRRACSSMLGHPHRETCPRLYSKRRRCMGQIQVIGWFITRIELPSCLFHFPHSDQCTIRSVAKTFPSHKVNSDRARTLMGQVF